MTITFYVRKWHIPFPFAMLEGRYGEYIHNVKDSAILEKMAFLLEKASWEDKTDFLEVFIGGILRPETEKLLTPKLVYVVTHSGHILKYRSQEKPEPVWVQKGTVLIGTEHDRWNFGLRITRDKARPKFKRITQ